MVSLHVSLLWSTFLISTLAITNTTEFDCRSTWFQNTNFPCTIDRVPFGQLTSTLFASLYEEKKPVVIIDWHQNSRFGYLCSKGELLASHGEKLIVLSSANSYSYDKRYVSLSEYISRMMGPQNITTSGDQTFYHFGDHLKDFEHLLSQYKPPNLGHSSAKATMSWGLAGDGTGVPFHTHGAVFAEVFWGKKRWFLTPPGKKAKLSS